MESTVWGAGVRGSGRPWRLWPRPLPREAGSDPLWVDPLRDRADACLDGLAEVARLEARFAALKVWLTADYVAATRALAPPALSPHDRTVQEMARVAELACVLTVSEQSAGALICQAQALTASLPLTLGALQAGTVSWAHARILVDETTGWDPVGAAGLEAHFLDPGAPNPARGCPAGDLTPGRFRAKARVWRERHHPVSIGKRHTRCAADRRVEYCPDRDGMAWLNTYLPASTAAGIWDRTTAAARALQGPDEPRTLTQLRADIAATLLLSSDTTGTGNPGGTTDETTEGTAAGTADGMAGVGAGMAGGAGVGGVCGGVPVPRALVLVTVPVLSLLGAGEEPAVLDGYGPIPPSMARALVADGADSFHRVLTDPRDGAPLEIGRTSYRLTTAQRRWLRLRDGRCPFPGCSNPSLDNDADHLLGWADGGTTGISNLGQPCRKHHRLKHGSTWTPAGASKHSPRAGPPRRGGPIPANSRTGNHPTGRTISRRLTRFWAMAWMRTESCPRAKTPTWNCHRTPAGNPNGPASGPRPGTRWNRPRIPSRTGPAPRLRDRLHERSTRQSGRNCATPFDHAESVTNQVEGRMLISC